MEVKVIYEDDSIVGVYKPTNLVVNRSETTNQQTLQDWLSSYFNLKKADLGIGKRAGIVHRLDKGTSGILLVAKTKAAFASLQKQFYKRQIDKTYIALSHGKFTQTENKIISKLSRSPKERLKFAVVKEGREAITSYLVEKLLVMSDELFKKLIVNFSRNRRKYLENNARLYSLLKIYPKTGRTHQIRVQLARFQHPVVSDPIYDPPRLIDFDRYWCPRLFLHASQIIFTHPKTGKKITLTSNLPNDLKNSLQYLLEVRG